MASAAASMVRSKYIGVSRVEGGGLRQQLCQGVRASDRGSLAGRFHSIPRRSSVLNALDGSPGHGARAGVGGLRFFRILPHPIKIEDNSTPATRWECDIHNTIVGRYNTKVRANRRHPQETPRHGQDLITSHVRSRLMDNGQRCLWPAHRKLVGRANNKRIGVRRR